MNRGEYVHLLGEKKALERLIAETPKKNAIMRASLRARLSRIEKAIANATLDQWEPARVRLTFKGNPVVGSHGILAEFGAEAVNGYAKSTASMAASIRAPLGASGPIPDKDHHQLMIIGTVIGSFGFELEERNPQTSLFDSPVKQAIERVQKVLSGTLGSDDDLAESVADIDRRALDNVRAFLKTVADNDAVCTVQFGDSVVSFANVDQVRNSIERLSKNNLQEQQREVSGELQGVLPDGRSFEFKVADSSQIIRGRIAPAIADPDVLNRELRKPMTVTLIVRRVGKRPPSYLLLKARPQQQP